MIGVVVFLAGIAIGVIGTLSVQTMARLPRPAELPPATARQVRRDRARRLDIQLALARPGAEQPRLEAMPSIHDFDHERTR